MPFLLPPPEFKPGELTQMGLTGTCEMQICRSAGPWSLGTPSRIEHSIQNAYLKGSCSSSFQRSSIWRDNSHPNVRALCLHWEPVLHHLVSLICCFLRILTDLMLTNRTVVNDVKVENQIGDALVSRIIRAHREGTPWKCCIMIPVLPGFTFPVDHTDASAVRWWFFELSWHLPTLFSSLDPYHIGVPEPYYRSRS